MKIMKFQGEKTCKTWNSVKIVEVVQAVSNTAHQLEKSIFRDFGISKTEKSTPNPTLTLFWAPAEA